MRQGSHSKRNRGRGGSRRSGTPSRNHTFDSNGPDIRIRGNAHQVHEKYINLAREASTNGEAVLAESYFQHAEHYYRILSAITDESNSEHNKNRSNQSSSGENNNAQQQTSSVSKTGQNGTEKDTKSIDPEVAKENQSALEFINSESKEDLPAFDMKQQAASPAKQEEPALALRSGDRLNINLSSDQNQVVTDKHSPLKLENVDASEALKNGQNGIKRKRGPRNNPQNDTIDDQS